MQLERGRPEPNIYEDKHRIWQISYGHYADHIASHFIGSFDP